VIGKLRSLSRGLTIRRQGVTPGWVGLEMAEECDERIADVEESMAARVEWLEQDVERLNQAQSRVS
jgi:predicted DNA-binding transcriptional regulator